MHRHIRDGGAQFSHRSDAFSCCGNINRSLCEAFNITNKINSYLYLKVSIILSKLKKTCPLIFFKFIKNCARGLGDIEESGQSKCLVSKLPSCFAPDLRPVGGLY